MKRPTISSTQSDWLMKLPDVVPDSALIVYPRDTLDVPAAKAAMVAMGYNMNDYNVRTHGNALWIKRWPENSK